jgi:opacity protein-like surface antigen
MTRGARPTIFWALWAVVLIAALAASGPAAAAATPAGRWAGEVDTPDGKKAEFHLVLDQKDGAWTGTLEDPRLGSAALSGIKVAGTNITFRYQPQGAPFALNFSGLYAAGDDRISGTFSLQGSNQSVRFNRVVTAAIGAPATGAAGTAAAPADTTTTPALRTKHPYRLAVTGRVGWWASLHSVKDESYTMNNLTAAAPAFDGAVKWFVMDGLSVFVRGVRAGQNVTDDAVRLAVYARNGLTADSYLTMDGVELGVAGYLGNKMMPRSHFNPYISGGVGRYSWAMTSAGRGTDPVTIAQAAVEGTSMGGWFGLGTEYALNNNMALDLECAWRIYLTRDTKTWRDSEDVWGNSLAWAMSAGLTYGF